MKMIHIKDSIVVTPNKYVLIGGYLLRKFNVYRTEPTYEGWGKCGACSFIPSRNSSRTNHCDMIVIDLSDSPKFLCEALGDLREFRQMRYNDRGVFMKMHISLFLSSLIIRRSKE